MVATEANQILLSQLINLLDRFRKQPSMRAYNANDACLIYPPAETLTEDYLWMIWDLRERTLNDKLT